MMGMQPIVFPPETLDKPEAHQDVAGYLAQLVDVAVVRAEMPILDGLAGGNHLPVVNAMTGENHHCEVLSDLWALSLRVVDFASLCHRWCAGQQRHPGLV
ncbi:MAG: hypothetical protein ACRDAX_05725 [Propionibacteriaceae bacterium]